MKCNAFQHLKYNFQQVLSLGLTALEVYVVKSKFCA